MATNKTIPSEFAGFVRDTTVRAFDRLAERVKELDPPLRSVMRAWSKLKTAEKKELVNLLMASAQDSVPKRRTTRGANPT